MELKISLEILNNFKMIVMYVDGACHAVAHDHPSVSSTLNNIARNLDAVINDVNIINSPVEAVESQPRQQ